jgi:hypothetical protein
VIAAVRRALDALRGEGDHSVTVPPMDWALNPNNALEEAPVVASAEAPDNLCLFGNRLLFATGAEIRAIEGEAGPALMSLDAAVTSLAAEGGALAVALASGKIVIRGGAHDGAEFASLAGRPLGCVTALAFDGPDSLLICVGSETHPLQRWKHDLMQLGCSGSVWRADLRTGALASLAQKLGFPFGVPPVRGGASVAESWRHRLVLLRDGRPPEPVLFDLPAYPARLSRAADGGAWLALFAPRRQLTEFILREPRYRECMMAEIAPEYWVRPTLAPMASFLQPFAGRHTQEAGGHQTLAPSRSYGMVAKLDAEWQPVASFHSRADGSRHGVMCALERQGRLYAASQGARAVVAIDFAREA